MSNLKSQISNIQSALQAVYPKDEAASLAWWIMEEETGLTRTELLCGCKDTTNFANMQKIQTIIDRLLHFEPIQYIFGHTLWCGLDLLVTPATLIPRPETAELVERVSNLKSQISNLKSPARVLDIGTGSGCIAIALKKAHPSWSITGIDISPEAIATARENARRNNVEVNFQVADILSPSLPPSMGGLRGASYDIVVSNPPYICESEKSSMRPNVLNFEPSSALFVPDSDPLLFYRRIAELISLPYREGLGLGYLFFEINEAFGEELKQLLSNLGYTDIQIHKDIYGKDRIIEARMAR